jgi:heme/copper-type cytochrome/quinol oxidase subunit 3
VTAGSSVRNTRAGTVWAAAVPLAALGDWILFDTQPGLNWLIWSACAHSLLFLFSRDTEPGLSPRIPIAITGVLLAGGAVATANEFLHFLIFLSTITCLAVAMLLASNPSWDRIRAGFVIPAPIVAFGHAIVESVHRLIEALHLVRSNRARSVLGGIAISLPVLIIFALLLSSADPTFASWRIWLEKLFQNWEFLPRVVFFIGLLAIGLGAYGFAARGDTSIGINPGDAQRRWLGETERLILIGSVAALLSLFLLMQLSYLFGNVPLTTGSNMSFAEYAQKGFGELTTVASGSALLILLSERYGQRGSRDKQIRIATLTLLVAVLFLLGSAFNRVLLYEAAYGFTTSRLYAQFFMLVVAAGLLILGREVFGEIDTPRVFRRAGAAATIALLVLIYWNHEAWIAGKNIDRFASTGKLDAQYITNSLSPNAVPTVVARMATLPPPTKAMVLAAIHNRYSGRRKMLDGKWYEWNYHRAEALKTLERIGVNLDAPRATPYID